MTKTERKLDNQYRKKARTQTNRFYIYVCRYPHVLRVSIR